MHEMTRTLHELGRARYALLRTYRRDGTPVDTPIWFHQDATTLVFRTKIGPKTKRLAAHPRVELRACDHRGRVRQPSAARAIRLAVQRRSAAADPRRHQRPS
jgi:uncharacterized protein